MENKGEMLQPSLIFTILSRRESLIERGGGGNLLQNLTTNKGGGLYRGVGGSFESCFGISGYLQL